MAGINTKKALGRIRIMIHSLRKDPFLRCFAVFGPKKIDPGM